MVPLVYTITEKACLELRSTDIDEIKTEAVIKFREWKKDFVPCEIKLSVEKFGM